MSELSTVIVLLTVTVIILSVVVVALLAVIAVFIMRVNRIAKHVEEISTNVSNATDWLSPTKLIATAVEVFRR